MFLAMKKFFFFFSSRRRHTRSYGDWSSDVCSSDLFEQNDLLLEVWTWEGHPCVLVSNQRRIDHKQKIVLLKCQTLYSGDPPANEFESVLDQEDGLQRRSEERSCRERA